MPTYPRTTLPNPNYRPPAAQRPKPKKKKLVAPKGYLGGWAQNPNLNKKKFKTVRTGQGYYIAKKLSVPKGPGGPGGPKPPVTPKPPPGPYDSYPDWAKRTLTGMDTDTANEQANALKVQQWLTGALAPIQAASQSASQNYRSSIAALPNAGNMGIPQVGAMSPGGTTMASPDAWKMNAATSAAAGYNTAQQGQGAISSFLADSGLGNLRSALETNFAQELLRLGETRKKEKSEYLSKLDQFLAESEAEAQQGRAELAQKTTNDWYDFIAQLTNAGVRLTDVQMDAMKPPTGSGGVVVRSSTMPNNPKYDWTQESPGVWRGILNPTPVKPPNTKPTGVTGPFQRRPPPLAGYQIIKDGNKFYYVKKGGTGAGSGSGTGTSPEQKRIQFKEAKASWVGEAPNNAVGTGGTPGLKDAPVNGFTDSAGAVPPGTPGPRRSYVFNVRVYRLREQILASTEDKARTDTILKGILGSRNFARFNTWRLASNARGDLSFFQAKKRKHV